MLVNYPGLFENYAGFDGFGKLQQPQKKVLHKYHQCFVLTFPGTNITDCIQQSIIA